MASHFLNPVRLSGLMLQNSAFSPLSAFMCFVWFSEEKGMFFSYTRLSYYFYNGDRACLLRGRNSVTKYDSGQFSYTSISG